MTDQTKHLRLQLKSVIMVIMPCLHAGSLEIRLTLPLTLFSAQLQVRS